MDGYSVTEAASVLGVPIERVWELLARGVLSGAPEGDTGMRVYLQPRPKPAAAEDPRRPNGDRVGTEPERELSPFRELLTEFRGLTERYGQALLALGEARGEVAALRSRVDLLEARMDLRLPMGAQSSVPPWPGPTPEAPRAPAPFDHVVPEPDHPDEEEHRMRSRGPRRATDSFAAALARAEDPSAPELRPATAPGEPHSAPRDAEAGDAAEPGLPRELPPADTVPVADEAEPAVEAHPVVEPHDSVEPIAADVEPEGPDAAVEVESDPVIVEAAAPEPVEATPELAEADVEPVEERATAAEAQPEPVEEPMAAVELEAEPVEVEPEPVEVEPEPIDAEPEPAPEPAAAVEVEAEQGASDVQPEAIDFDADRYTTAIEEPDWFEAEVEQPVAQPTQVEPEPQPELRAEEPEPEPESESRAEEPEPEPELQAEDPEAEPEPTLHAEEPEPEPEPEAQPKPVEPATPEEPAPPHVASAADEETMLWFGRRPADTGADEMEVAGSVAPWSAAADEPTASDLLPGSLELDEALASLEELTRRTRQAGPAEGGEWPPTSAGLAEPNQPSSGASAWAVPSPRTPFIGPGRPGSPATRAYRRLRRIFPG